MIGKAIKDHLTQLSPEGMSSEPLIEQYSDIVLTPEQEAEALRLGRENEHKRLKTIEYNRRLSEPRQIPKFNQEQLWDFYELAYAIDEDNKKVVRELCYYFSGDNRFSGDLQKGLLIGGNVGLGKTALMQFFSRNQIYSYRVVSCRDVEKQFSQTGYEAVDAYSSNYSIAVNSNPFGHQVIGYCFDDLGTEDNSKFYGTEKNMMAEIILNRYDRKLPKTSTHITTNLTAKGITDAYGTRVSDRLKEMVNIITFPTNAKSRR